MRQRVQDNYTERKGVSAISTPSPESLVKVAERQGWRVKATKSGYMIFPPDPTARAITVHKTESDHRAIKNTIARLKRAGLVIE